MKISNEALNVLRFSKTAKARLMYEFNLGPSTIQRWISENLSDGDMTRVRVVKLLAEELNLPEESILIDDKPINV